MKSFIVHVGIILLPSLPSYGPWPRSGEVDIVTSKGNDDIVCGGAQFGNTRITSNIIAGLNRQKQFKVNFHTCVGILFIRNCHGWVMPTLQEICCLQSVKILFFLKQFRFDSITSVNETIPSDFHVYSVSWGPEGFVFAVDGTEYGRLDVGEEEEEGIWGLAGFGDEDQNIWRQGSSIAPFDKPVRYILYNTWSLKGCLFFIRIV